MDGRVVGVLYIGDAAPRPGNLDGVERVMTGFAR